MEPTANDESGAGERSVPSHLFQNPLPAVESVEPASDLAPPAVSSETVGSPQSDPDII